jgi:hypothetical protein
MYMLEKIWINGSVKRAVTVYCLPDRKERLIKEYVASKRGNRFICGFRLKLFFDDVIFF